MKIYQNAKHSSNAHGRSQAHLQAEVERIKDDDSKFGNSLQQQYLIARRFYFKVLKKGFSVLGLIHMGQQHIFWNWPSSKQSIAMISTCIVSEMSFQANYERFWFKNIANISRGYLAHL